VTFTLVTYSVEFTESGLPAGMEWWVNLTNGQSYSSTSGNATFVEPNGTYDFSVEALDEAYAASASSGSFVVTGGPVEESITFGFGYAITWTESGLPPATEWWVNLTNGHSVGSVKNSFTFREPNGTYNYDTAAADKEYASPGGSFTVAGAAMTQNVTFTLVTLSVTFNETGLPVGTAWWVNLTNGPSFPSFSSLVVLVEPNGSYNFSIATANKSFASPGGHFLVHGTPVNVSVAFALLTYRVTFRETGVGSGQRWWLNFTNGRNYSSTTPTISFNVPNGTYLYTAEAQGYVGLSGDLSVQGASVGPIQLSFRSPSTSPAVSVIDEVGIGAATASILIAVTVVLLLRRRKNARPPTEGSPAVTTGGPPSS